MALAEKESQSGVWAIGEKRGKEKKLRAKGVRLTRAGRERPVTAAMNASAAVKMESKTRNTTLGG